MAAKKLDAAPDAFEHERLKAAEQDIRSQSRKRTPASRFRAKVQSTWDGLEPPLKWENLSDQWRQYLIHACRAYVELDLAPEGAWNSESFVLARYPKHEFGTYVTRLMLAFDNGEPEEQT